MLTRLVQTDLRLLNLGAKDHAALLGQDAEACAAVFKAADYCCHVCGAHVPHGLEIDHTAGHGRGPQQVAGMKAICQFCHNLKHPLWAAARGRIVPIWAPDMGQVDLNRLAWAMIGWREVHQEQFANLHGDLVLRVHRFAEAFECESAEGLLEAAFASLDTLGREEALRALAKVDQVLRFVPAEALLEAGQIGDPTIDHATRLSTWSIGGFRKIPRTVARTILEGHDPEALQVFGEESSDVVVTSR